MELERRNFDTRVTLTVSESARRYLQSLDTDTEALVLLYGIDDSPGGSSWMPFTLPKRHLGKRGATPFVTRLGSVSVVVPQATLAPALNGCKLDYVRGALSLD